MVRPALEVDLCNVLSSAVSFLNLHLSAVAKAAFLDFFEEVDEHAVIFFVILSDSELGLASRGPELVALCSSLLLETTGRYNHGDIVFNDHLPKVMRRFRQWSLRGNDLAISFYVSFQDERRVDVAGVDVVTLWFLFIVDAVCQLDSCLLVDIDIDVPVSLLIYLVNQLLLVDFFQLVESLKVRILSLHHLVGEGFLVLLLG